MISFKEFLGEEKKKKDRDRYERFIWDYEDIKDDNDDKSNKKDKHDRYKRFSWTKPLKEELSESKTHPVGHYLNPHPTLEKDQHDRNKEKSLHKKLSEKAYNHEDKLKNKHIETLDKYKGDHHSYVVNKSLRKYKGEVKHNVKGFVKHMNDATNHKTEHDMHVYRGIGHLHDGNHKEFGKGRIIHDHGYVSTSISHSTGKRFAKDAHHKNKIYNGMNYKVIAKIHVPAGTKGHYIDGKHYHSQGRSYSHEKEFVIHKGTKFKITGHSRDEKNKTHYVHMTVHSQEKH